MSESIVRKIQPFTIGTKLSVPAVPKYSDVTEDNMSNRSLDNCKLQHNLNDKVSLYLDQPQMCVSERHCAPVMTQDTLEKRCQEEMVKEDHLNRNIASPTATSRAIRKITISSSVETTKETEILRAKQREMKINPNSENINNNNNITTDSAQLPRIVGVSCEKKPSSHFKVPVLLHRDSNNEPSSSNEQTSGFLLNLERCLDVQQTPVLQSQSLKNDLVKGNSSPCRQNEVSMVSKVLSVQKDYFFTQQNALFSKEISQAEAWIQEKLKKLKDIQTCSMMDWEEVTQTLQRDLKDFENTLIQLNQMGEQLMCKLNPTSDMVRKQLSQLRDQWNTLKQTAANQTRVISGFQSLHEFNKKVDKLEAWIKQKEEEPSLASPLGENNDKLQLTRQLLDLKQDKQLYRNLHEEINQLALKLEKQGKGEGKNISTRRKHINKMWLKIQSHLKDCQDNLQLALEASTFFQQADNFIASVNNMRKALSVTNQATFSGDGEILDIASQIMVLDVTVSQLSNLHPALAARVAEKQAKVKDSWLLLQSTVRNVKTEPLTSVCFVTGEDSDLSISNKELFSSMGMDQHRIMGKEVKDEQNRLKGTTGGRSLDLTRKPLDSHQEPLPNPVVSVGNTCTSEVSTKFQDQSKSGAMPKTHSHPHLHEQLEKFTVSADKTLSWLKDSVTMATHICSSGGGPSSYEAAKRYQASLEQDILSNKARIELVKKEGHSLVRAHHPGSAKIQDFLSQLEVLWEELKKRHQRNGMILRGSEELNYRAVKLLQGLGSLEAWLEAVELSIRQASLAGDPESVSVAERESRLLERELETHNLDLHNLKQELEALQSQRHLHTQLLPSRMEQVERKFRSIQMALTQQSSELKDTRMLTEFLERVELEENHYGSVGQPLQSDLDCASPLLPLRESRNSKPLIESLGDPVEELREAVEMLNDTARERSRSQSHDQCIQELISRHSIVVARVEQCLQRCTELAVDVLDMESEMAVRCEPEHCGMDSLQEQQDQLEADFAGLKEKVDAMDNLSARLLDLCPERVHTLGNKVQSSLQAWGELAKSIAENRSRLLQFGHLRHFFRKYLAMISWTEDTRSRIFSESALHHENQGSLVELLDKQIEQKFQEFDILASAGKKLLNEDHHLAKMIKERMEELRSMLGWILVHWRAQKIQWLNRKRAEEPHNDAIYSEATICSLLPELESETSSEDQLKTQGPVTVSLSGLEDNVQQDNGYELMESVTLKDSKTQSGSEELDSPYLVLKEPSTPSLGGTVNLILSFGNSGDSQLQVEESDTEKAEQFSEAVHRGHSLNFLSVHIDLEGAGPDSDTLVHSPTTRGHSSLVSGRREFPSMEGTLERKHKLLVGGRMALCRTWSSYHAVLYRQTLCFYHDRKDTISNSVISFPINLNGAECVQAPEYTKKPNCFSLRLCDGSEYLFSAPSHFMMKKWILQIQANTESSESEANINTSCGPAAQSVFPRSVSSPVRCQCEALCQCSMKGEESLNLPSCRQLGSARTKQIIFLEQDSSNIPQQHCEKMEELSSTLYSHASHYDSLGDLPDQKLHSQSFRGLSYSLCPSQDCSTSKKRSHSFTSATYQRIKPVRLPPKGRGQDSNSSYSVTLFIGDGEKPSVCSSTALLQPISSRQKSPELPHMSYASLPQSQSKSVFRKFFGKKD